MEIGTNHPGEIAHLTRMVAPQMGIITSVGGSHLGQFGSVEAVAEEKGWLAALLPDDGQLFLHAESPWYEACASRTKAPCTSVGFSANADWRLGEPELRGAMTACRISNRELDLDLDFEIPAHGRHQVVNAGLALACAVACGLEASAVVDGLARAQMPDMRMQVIPTRKVVVWNDAYNANEDSVVAAMDTFQTAARSDGRRIVVLGELNELGEHQAAVYRRLARATMPHGFDLMVGIGPATRVWLEELESLGGGEQCYFDSLDQAVAALPDRLQDRDQLLLKASRSARLERLAETLVETFGRPAEDASDESQEPQNPSTGKGTAT